MKLYPMQGPSLVANTHDLILGCPGIDDEIGMRPGASFDDETMVPGGLERIAETVEDASVIVVDGGCFPMHDPPVADDVATKDVADALVP